MAGKKRSSADKSDFNTSWHINFYGLNSMNAKAKNIVITGGAGFLGRFMTKIFLDNDYQVHVFDKALDSRMEGTDFCAVKNFFKKIKPIVVINLMALTGSQGKGGGIESLKEPYDYFRVNFLTTLNVFEASRRLGINKIIHMSSFALYGVTGNESIDENSPLDPNAPYGGSKHCAEIVAEVYSRCFGIKTVVVRAPLIVGEGQSELNALQEFIHSARDGMPIVLFGDGSHCREWIHPIDVAEAFLRMLQYIDRMRSPYEVFVLGSERTRISMSDLAKKIIRRIGKSSVVYENRDKKAFNQITDGLKVKTLLGWQTKISIDEIIDRIISSI